MDHLGFQKRICLSFQDKAIFMIANHEICSLTHTIRVSTFRQYFEAQDTHLRGNIMVTLL